SPRATVRADRLPPTVRRCAQSLPAGVPWTVAGGGPCPPITTSPITTSPSRTREGPHHEPRVIRYRNERETAGSPRPNRGPHAVHRGRGRPDGPPGDDGPRLSHGHLRSGRCRAEGCRRCRAGWPGRGVVGWGDPREHGRADGPHGNLALHRHDR